MFCSNCGHQIPYGSAFCPNCGQATQLATSPQPNSSQQPSMYNVAPENQQESAYQYSTQNGRDTRPLNGLCVGGFVVGLVSVCLVTWGFLGILALILSAVGRSDCVTKNERGRGLATAGLVLGIVGLVLATIVTSIFVSIWSY